MYRLFAITCLTVCLTGFLFLAGCSDSDPLAPVSDPAVAVEKEAEVFDIAGTITNGNPLGLERRFETPSGIIHLFGYTVEAFTDGDLVSAGVFVLCVPHVPLWTAGSVALVVLLAARWAGL